MQKLCKFGLEIRGWMGILRSLKLFCPFQQMRSISNILSACWNETLELIHRSEQGVAVWGPTCRFSPSVFSSSVCCCRRWRHSVLSADSRSAMSLSKTRSCGEKKPLFSWDYHVKNQTKPPPVNPVSQTTVCLSVFVSRNAAKYN